MNRTEGHYPRESEWQGPHQTRAQGFADDKAVGKIQILWLGETFKLNNKGEKSLLPRPKWCWNSFQKCWRSNMVYSQQQRKESRGYCRAGVCFWELHTDLLGNSSLGFVQKKWKLLDFHFNSHSKLTIYMSFFFRGLCTESSPIWEGANSLTWGLNRCSCCLCTRGPAS